MPEHVLRMAPTQGAGAGAGAGVGRGKRGPRRLQPHDQDEKLKRQFAWRVVHKRVNSLIDKIEMLQPERDAYIQFGMVL